ncbi:MAG: hypothetical protein RQ985_05440 [Dehalococcoidia bacterium]|nr:hypothetical protein [Dehalococcoidia bacterium]
MPDHPRQFQALRRVKYMHLDSPVGWEELARVVAAQRQAMVVLNTRLDALRLLSELEAMGH